MNTQTGAMFTVLLRGRGQQHPSSYEWRDFGLGGSAEPRGHVSSQVSLSISSMEVKESEHRLLSALMTANRTTATPQDRRI